MIKLTTLINEKDVYFNRSIDLIKNDLRKLIKGNHNVTTMLNFIKQKYPEFNLDDIKDFATKLYNAKQTKILNKPSYSGRNIRY